MASQDELSATIEARMEEILQDASTLERDPRTTITPPSRKRADSAGKQAIEVLRRLGPTGGGVELRGTIGAGGMGVVRAAQQIALGREVAVKTLKDDARTEAATLKLLREAWVTGALEHPNVVPVYDISMDAEGNPQIVLKKIGGSAWCDVMRDEAGIRQRFQARDPFEWNVRILMQVCNAVHFAHARGILHRDLKPENVMIGEFGEVYVLDWGIAVSLRDDGTGRLPLAEHATDMAGTPAYMAPEMLGGALPMLTPRTDVYLLGAILFEIVAGRPPHDGTSLMEILHQVARSRPALPDDVPAELARIVKRALDPDPDARFESAEQLRLALGGFLEHRGSLKLASEAEARLAELEDERAQPNDDPDERRLRLYHVFGECRFGFLEALRIWRDNEKARMGLRRAIATMIEVELEAGDPKAAALLLAELEDPPAELATRVAEAKRARDAEDAHRAKLARDLDPTIGRRTRVFLALVVTGAWTIGPWLALWWGRSHPEADQGTAIGVTSAMLAACGALAFWGRESLSRTAINRRLVRVVGLAMIAQIGLFAATWAIGLTLRQTQPILLFLYATMTAFTVATVEARLWPSALAFAIAAAIGTVAPAWVWPLESAANFVLSVNVAASWGRMQDDVVTPLRERGEQRRRRWQAFLERQSARSSLPAGDGESS